MHIESPDVHFAYLSENQIAHNALDGVYVDGADVIEILMYRNSIYHNRMGICLVDGANGGIEAPTILIPQPYNYLTATAIDDELGTSEFSAAFANPIRNVFIPLVER